MNIRIVEPKDVIPIMEIYRYYIDHTDITFEYVLPSPEEFTERIRGIVKKYPYLVAEEDGQVIGYAYAGAFKTRAAYDWSAEISIYLHKDKRGGGIGTALYQEIEKYLLKQNIINVHACITYPNDASIAFHEKMGYRKVAHFEKCGYKFERWLDMIWMQKFLAEHPDKPRRAEWFGMDFPSWEEIARG